MIFFIHKKSYPLIAPLNQIHLAIQFFKKTKDSHFRKWKSWLPIASSVTAFAAEARVNLGSKVSIIRKQLF